MSNDSRKSNTATAEEMPVKRRYFFPEYEMTVEATSVDEALEIAKGKAKKEDDQ